MKDVIYLSKDTSLEICLQFIVKRRLKYTHLGKGYPKHTQCLMYRNGILECFETIIKHERDEDNQLLAYRIVAEKCLKHIEDKCLRGDVRLVLNKALKDVDSTIVSNNDLFTEDQVYRMVANFAINVNTEAFCGGQGTTTEIAEKLKEFNMVDFRGTETSL